MKNRPGIALSIQQEPGPRLRSLLCQMLGGSLHRVQPVLGLFILCRAAVVMAFAMGRSLAASPVLLGQKTQRRAVGLKGLDAEDLEAVCAFLKRTDGAKALEPVRIAQVETTAVGGSPDERQALSAPSAGRVSRRAQGLERNAGILQQAVGAVTLLGLRQDGGDLTSRMESGLSGQKNQALEASSVPKLRATELLLGPPDFFACRVHASSFSTSPRVAQAQGGGELWLMGSPVGGHPSPALPVNGAGESPSPARGGGWEGERGAYPREKLAAPGQCGEAITRLPGHP